MDYKLMAARKDPDWDMLHERYAPLVLDLTLQLRGLYVKLGQQASTMTIVPPQYRAKLQMLQKGVPPKPLEEVRAMIERSFGWKFSELFSSFEEQCIGSASVGHSVSGVLPLTGSFLSEARNYWFLTKDFKPRFSRFLYPQKRSEGVLKPFYRPFLYFYATKYSPPSLARLLNRRTGGYII